jgi:hypothetical protein
MFRAERVEDGGAVAVLILHAGLIDRSESFTRLEQEVQALQRLRGPLFNGFFPGAH